MQQANMNAMREQRVVLTGQVRYRYDEHHGGLGYWVNVSRSGGAVRLGRYLRPGRAIGLLAPCPGDASREVAVAARVVWCRPIGDGSQFLAGLEMERQVPEEALAHARWVWLAREQAAARAAQVNESQRTNVSVKGVWPGFQAGTRPHHTAEAV